MCRTKIFHRENYRSLVLRSSIAALAIHFLTFLFFPAFEFTPYRMAEETVMDLVEMEPVPVADLEPEEIPQPAIAIPVVDDGSGEEIRDGAYPVNSPVNGLTALPIMPVFENAGKEFYAFDKCPVLVRSVRPDYPELARLAGIEGEVVLRVLVGPDGRVIDALVIRSSVTKEMEKAAISAVLQFIFEPAVQGVVPVAASVAVPVTFRLH
ncbi:MAG TPA: energy transducer TonB [Candidatus Krumholzibacterium sp.]|nr:energy transducer TonB [Candidatus Krumholzibacterium sp.]